jgi:hypothetical protein
VPIPNPSDQLRFLKDIQALLEDGQFIATYKFALLIALADLAVESGIDDDRPLTVPLSAIADKYVEYYWQQAAPYPGAGRAQVLAQNSGQQAAVIRVLMTRRQDGFDSLARLRTDGDAYTETLKTIAGTIRQMPLFRLQAVGGIERTFLYEHVVQNGAIELKPGVAYHLRQFHPLVTGLARERWLAMVRRMPANLYAVGQSQDLEAFLFGAGREPVGRHLGSLLEIQRGQCLYCSAPIRIGAGHVDHFIPWILHRCDARANLVAAHDQCNLAKKALLASEAHIESWTTRNAEAFGGGADPDGSDGPAEWDRVSRIALWAYDRAFDLRSPVWEGGNRLGLLSGDYKKLLPVRKTPTWVR